MIYFTIVFIVVLGFFYLRYLPVGGVQWVNITELDEDDKIKFLDVRDYNVSYKTPISNGVNIPIAYLKRNYQDIPKLPIYVIASDTLEKNITIRFLRKKGFEVKGYTLISSNKTDSTTQYHQNVTEL